MKQAKENTIGHNIQMYREKKGLTQTEFAKRINIKNTRLSNWENGQNYPPADYIGKICEALDISASELLGLKLSNDEFSYEERRIILKYRANKEMQHAIKVLLGMEIV